MHTMQCTQCNAHNTCNTIHATQYMQHNTCNTMHATQYMQHNACDTCNAINMVYFMFVVTNGFDICFRLFQLFLVGSNPKLPDWFQIL